LVNLNDSVELHNLENPCLMQDLNFTRCIYMEKSTA